MSRTRLTLGVMLVYAGLTGCQQITAVNASCSEALTCPTGTFCDSRGHCALDTVPGAPTNVVATGGNQSAVISWTAPDDNGSPITSYAVTSTPGGLTATVTSATATVPGLDNGTIYTFTVVATNGLGHGPVSAPSNPVTPVTVPSAPRAVSAMGGNGEAIVSWTEPVSDGGSAITEYIVSSASTAGAAVPVATTSGATTVTVSGLTDGASYTFTVISVNVVGPGPSSAPSSPVTPVSVPGPPTDVMATAGNAGAQVSWTAPSAGGSPILQYVVMSTSGDLTATTSPPSTSVFVSGLNNGMQYTFTVYATNEIGPGPSSTSSNTVTPLTVPGAPTNVMATAGNGEAKIIWTAPASDGGSAITSYTVTYTYAGNDGGVITVGESAGSDGATISGLMNGFTYIFTVHATNAVGNGPDSTVSNAVIPCTQPGAPLNVTATTTGATATVTWMPPESDGGSSITTYTATSDPGGATMMTDNCCTATFSGLTYGTVYIFTVAATNAAGKGPPSSPSNVVIPVTTPGAPSNVTATAGSGQATASWSPPSFTGGNTISSYTVISYTVASMATTPTITVSTSSATLTGLTDGASYTFTVTATNAVGSGPPSLASAPVTPTSPPGAPIITTVTAGNAQATIQWNAPVTNGGLSITGYTVTSSSGLTASTTRTTATVSGLTNGVSYTFTVTASNADGPGPASLPSDAVIPATVPDAPTGATAIAGNAEATVSWMAPDSNGGSAITGYMVTSAPGGVMASTAGATGTSATVTGLINGTSYTFTVVAMNAAGAGSPSPPSNVATPSTVPGAPLIGTATAGNGQATISWSPPASDGGLPISSYTVTSTPDGMTATTTATTATMTGLTNGTSYTFTVIATNADGNGPPSSASNAVTPATVPGAPTSVNAVAGNAQSIVFWTSPSSNGGSAITGYTVTSTPGGVTANTTSSTDVTVSGLTNGVSYTFVVVATNVAGSGPGSASSSPVTPSTVPSAPTAVVATAGNGEALVSWTPPASNGSGILGYTITSTPGGITVPAGEATSATVGGLTNGTSYTFTVTATNGDGTGASSPPSNAVTPAAVPGSPTGVSAASGTSEAIVSWTAPADDGGSAITSYTVTASPGGFTANAISVTSTTVTGLTNGVSYSFTVVATNGVGGSLPSLPSNTVVPTSIPAAPGTVTATAGNGQASVIWSAPDANGSPISGYTVTSIPGGLTATTTGGTSATVTGLTNGTSYTFTIAATNGDGPGPASLPSNAVTPATVPDAPTVVTAMGGKGAASVSWTAPDSDGGGAITAYMVTSSPGGLTAMTMGSTGVTVSGLTNGVSYTFTVTATNAAGTGVASAPSNAVVPSSVPDAPTMVTATAGTAEASVAWVAPAANGSPLSGYTVISNPGGFSTTTAATDTSAVVTGLTNGTSYTFTVFATNGDGNGPSSAPSNAVTPAIAPGAPTAVVATAGTSEAAVSWTPPSSNGGNTIISYTVTSTPGSFTATVSGSTSATVTGLTNGVSYTFTVTATNGIGTGLPSSPSNSVTPNSVPGAPTSVMAVAGNAQATVTWGAAVSNGSPISGYVVTSDPGGITATTQGATTAVVSGLANGTSYTFTVVASNGDGSGPPSAPSNAVTPATVPGSPTTVKATGANAQAAVTWAAPANNGGSAVTGYTVTSSPGGFTATTTGALSATVGGLTNGTSYTFTVVATNVAGSGAASTASNAVVPATVPGAPTNVVATAVSGAASVTWTAPASTGGSPITGYTVTCAPGGAQVTTGVGTSATVMGLAVDTSYSFTVTATNAVGNGPPSAASNAILFLGPPSSATSSVAVSPGSVTADGRSIGTITVTLRDAGGNALPSQGVNLTVTGTGDKLTPSSGNTGSGGTFTASLSSWYPQTKQVLATAGGVSLTTSVVFTKLDCTQVTGFETDVSYGVGPYAASVATGDFNGDGALDLVVANSAQNTGNLSVLLGTGTGTFQTMVNYSAGNSPRFVTTHDMNGDGVLDLIVANDDSPPEVSVLLGNGNGTFQGAANYSTGAGSISLTIADFNGDGVPDVAVTAGSSVDILLGTGGGNLGGATAFTAGSSLTSVTSGDFNGDGVIDLAVASSENGTPGMNLLLGGGSGSFALVTKYTLPGGDYSLGAVASGDFNGDGRLDVAMANESDNGVSVFIASGSSLLAGITYGTGSSPDGITLADFNGDGNLDIATVNDLSTTVSLLLGNGDGTFQKASSYAVASRPWGIASGDFNEDGYVDIVSANYDTPNVSLLLNECLP